MDAQPKNEHFSCGGRGGASLERLALQASPGRLAGQSMNVSLICLTQHRVGGFRPSSRWRSYALSTARWTGLGLVVGHLWTGGLGSALSASATTFPPADDAETHLFAKPTLVNIQLTLRPESQTALRNEPRQWVQADAQIDGRTFPQIAVHLKGTTSFLPLDKKPSFTFRFNKRGSGSGLYGLRRIHLNNSVQDRSYLCEDLTGELFRRAGVPSARTAWARVKLNERDLGLLHLFRPALEAGRVPGAWAGSHVRET